VAGKNGESQMVHSFRLRQQAFVAGVASLLLLALAGLAEGQTLRGPDLGLWFRQERDTSGASALIVDHLLDDGSFAAAGLREGDRIVSVDGRPIDSEPQFVRSVMRSMDGGHVVSLVITRSVVSSTAEQQTISLKTRDVWKGVVAADPFYQAGLLVDESLGDKSLADKSPVDKSLADKSLADKSFADKSPLDKRERDAVVIARVFPLTPAFYAGLRQFDTITSVSGQPVTSPADVAQYLRIGGRLAIGVTRGGESRQLHISLPRRASASTTYPPVVGFQPPLPQIPNLPPPPLLFPPKIDSPLPSSPQSRHRTPF
jgi:S1-C subfamily serine protease